MTQSAEVKLKACKFKIYLNTLQNWFRVFFKCTLIASGELPSSLAVLFPLNSFHAHWGSKRISAVITKIR